MSFALSQLSSALGGSSGGAIPLGSYADFPAGLGNTITVQNQTFLKSGVTALASTYPSVPVTGYLDSVLTNPSKTGSIISPASPGTTSLNLSWANNSSNTIALAFFSAGTGIYSWQSYYKTVDGINLTINVLPNRTSAPAGLIWFNNQFLMYFYDGSVYSSTDGDNWTFQTTIQGYYVRRIKICNNQVIIFQSSYYYGPNSTVSVNSGINESTGISNATRFIYSTDGINFNYSSALPSNSWKDIAWNGTKYAVVASGNDYATYGGSLVTSTSLTGTWSTTTLPTYGGSAIGCSFVESINGNFVISAGHAYNSYYSQYGCGYAYSTNNGTTFTYVPLFDEAGTATNYYFGRLYIQNNTLFYYVHNGQSGSGAATTGSSLVRSTTNGSTFSTVSPLTQLGQSSPSWRTGTGYDWGYVNGKWVSACCIPNSTMGIYFASSSGATAFATSTASYTTITNTTGSYDSGVNVVIGGNTILVIGSTGRYYGQYIPSATQSQYAYTTDNGVNWNIASLPVDGQWYAGCHDGTYFYILRRTSASNLEVYRSTTGNGTWTLVNTGSLSVTNGNVAGMGIVNGNLTIGLASWDSPNAKQFDTVYIYTSTDNGTTWTFQGNGTIGSGSGVYARWQINPTKTAISQIGGYYQYVGNGLSASRSYTNIVGSSTTNITGFWDNSGNLWSINSGYVYKNGIQMYSAATSPWGNVVTMSAYDTSSGKMYVTDGTSLWTSTTGTLWTQSTMTKQIACSGEYNNGFFANNGVLFCINTTIGLMQSSPNSYVLNQTPLSAVTGSTKYMRVA